MKYSGAITSIIHLSQDKEFVIARFQVIGGDEIVIKGNLSPYSEGSFISIDGKEENNPNYGKSFNVKKAMPAKPFSSQAYPMYLKSNFKNIGDIRAIRIANYFGDEMIKVLDDNPKSINDVPNIGKLAKESIINEWKTVRLREGVLTELVLTMYDIGFSITKVNKVIKVVKFFNINNLLKNPYELIKYCDISFPVVDSFAQKIGIDISSKERVMAGIEYYSLHLLEGGDCYIDFNLFFSNLKKQLIDDDMLLIDYLDEAVNEGLISTFTHKGSTIIMPRIYDVRENEIIEKINEIMENGERKFNKDDVSIIVDNIVVAGVKSFNDKQKEAIVNGLVEPISIITGGPGTGKTTVLKGFIKAYKAVCSRDNICFMAPTGKAAKRIEEQTGFVAKTIHRELYSMEGKGHLEYDVVVIDESSMIDLEIMHWLFSFISSKTKVILVGDFDQLEPVKEGKVFEDLVESAYIPQTRLSKGYRYDTGLLHKNAYNINQGLSIEIPNINDKDSDFYLMSYARNNVFNFDGKIKDVVVKLFSQHIPERKNIDPIRDIQILIPMKMGEVGVNKINEAIQAYLNPFTKKENQIIYGDKIFRVNDKIIQNENSYDKGVYNGDIGFIKSIKKGVVIAEFQEIVVEYPVKELDQISLAYAITIHKSQGSEFNYVIMPFIMSFYKMLTRKLLYTGITRAKKMALLVGETKAIDIAISNKNYKKRKTIFKEKIRGEISEY